MVADGEEEEAEGADKDVRNTTKVSDQIQQTVLPSWVFNALLVKLHNDVEQKVWWAGLKSFGKVLSDWTEEGVGFCLAQLHECVFRRDLVLLQR